MTKKLPAGECNYTSYLILDFEEVLKESDTAFLFLFADGEEEWVKKDEIADPARYTLGDRLGSVYLLTNKG